MTVVAEQARKRGYSSHVMLLLRYLAARTVLAVRSRRQRALLTALSRQQILDAGICLQTAGRGRAADIDPAAQANLGGMR